MQNLIVIPARYGSTRFPGKPLIEIAGRTMLDRVSNVAARAAAAVPGTEFVIATDDQRIADHAAALGHRAVMTATEIASGTDRALAVIEALGVEPEIVLNLQGDAPFTSVETVTILLEAAAGATHAGVTTPVRRLSWAALDALREHKKAEAFSGTTCVRAPDGRALWFSKNILPALRKEAKLRESGGMSPVLQHLGLYAYRVEALRRFAAAPPSFYEELEGLEQLRFLELGIPILAVDVPAPPVSNSGIDTPADVALAERLLAQHGDPYVAL